MTEFEQQVAAALTEIVSTWIYRDGVDEQRRLWRPEEIAPRVAAAIDKLARMYVDDVMGGTDETEAYQRVLAARRNDALKQLRGEA